MYPTKSLQQQQQITTMANKIVRSSSKQNEIEENTNSNIENEIYENILIIFILTRMKYNIAKVITAAFTLILLLAIVTMVIQNKKITENKKDI